MESTVDYEKKDVYVSRVHALMEDMRKWLEGTELAAKISEVVVNERVPGDYTVDQLEIFDSKREPVAKVIPVGAYVIGAEGRVDIKGYIGKEIIVYMKGSPAISAEENGVKNIRHYYKGIDHDGWYWIEDRRRMRALPFEKELFFELITMVSDHEV
jgi:hypothetical protein